MGEYTYTIDGVDSGRGADPVIETGFSASLAPWRSAKTPGATTARRSSASVSFAADSPAPALAHRNHSNHSLNLSSSSTPETNPTLKHHHGAHSHRAQHHWRHHQQQMHSRLHHRRGHGSEALSGIAEGDDLTEHSEDSVEAADNTGRKRLAGGVGMKMGTQKQTQSSVLEDGQAMQGLGGGRGRREAEHYPNYGVDTGSPLGASGSIIAQTRDEDFLRISRVSKTICLCYTNFIVIFNRYRRVKHSYFPS